MMLPILAYELSDLLKHTLTIDINNKNDKLVLNVWNNIL